MTGESGTAVLGSGRVLVWGTGAEGRSVAALALGQGADVRFVQDGDQADPVDVDGRLVPVLAPHALPTTTADVLVVSPGVSRYRPELEAVRARGVPVTSATAMWLADHADDRVVGVTGTKGKSTTAWLTALLLEESGNSVALGGNVGTPVTDLPSEGVDVYVVEVSSYQAAEVQSSPAVGVLTLLAPDHLDWHGGYDRYVADKLNLFRHRQDLALAVNGQCRDAVVATAELPGRRLYELDGPRLVVDGEAMADLPDGLRGEHNRQNLAGAVTAVWALQGALPTRRIMEAAVRRMPVLPGRLETVARTGDIEFVNDALASNPAGTLAALEAMSGGPLALIVGGRDRDVDAGPLVEAILARVPAPAVLGLDDFGARLVQQLQARGHRGPLAVAQSMNDAVDKSLDHLDGTGVVLFSPAAPTPAGQGSYLDRSAAFERAATAGARGQSPRAGN